MPTITSAYRTRRIACVAAGLIFAGSLTASILLVSVLTHPRVGTADIEAAVAGQFLLVILGPAIALNLVGSSAVLANVRWGPLTLRIGLFVTAAYAAAFVSLIVLADVAAGQPLAPSFLGEQIVGCALHAALGVAAILFASFLRRPQVLRHGNVPSTA